MGDITLPLKVTAIQAYEKAVQADAKATAIESVTNTFINGNPNDIKSVGAKALLYQLADKVETIEKKVDKTNGYLMTLVVTICGGVILYFINTILPKLMSIVSLVK
jgi:hypothetical protein